MADITLVDQDRVDAENFLEQFLRDRVPGDYGKGSALRDLAVTAFANIFAYLRQDNDNTRRRQSLLLLGQDSGADVDDMVDEILSNFFITRKTGRKSRGVATFYFSRVLEDNESLIIPLTALFSAASSLTYQIDATADLVYTADNMLPVFDTTGVVVEYALRVPLIATAPGVSYDIDPSSFVGWNFRNPYLTRIENASRFTGGGDKETTDEMLARAPTAISVRDLNSARAIDAVLREEFSELEDVFVTGFGDPEMVRDIVTELATRTRIHSGGFTDVYLKSPLLENEEFTATIGGLFTDPRPGYHNLCDHTVVDFTSTGGGVTAPVVKGDIIQIRNNLASEPAQYIVDEVNAHAVMVSSRNPFPTALPETDENWDDGAVGPAQGSADRLVSALHTFTSNDVGKWVRISSTTAGNNGTFLVASVATFPDNWAILQTLSHTAPVFTNETGLPWELQSRVVSYSIGNNSPNFNNHISWRLSGRFTKEIQKPGSIMLPSKPIYRISNVYIEDATDPDLSGTDGRITFVGRTNAEVSTPTNPTPPPDLDKDLLAYAVRSRDPNTTQSGWQVLEVQVGWELPLPATEIARFDGQTLHVVYDTISGYDSVWAYVSSDEHRLTCASVLARGLHPVYLSINVQYELAPTAVEDLDETLAAEGLADFITNYDTRLNLDVSDIMAYLRNTYSAIGYIAPLTINYDLYAPNGWVIAYTTQDKVVVDPSKYVNPWYVANFDPALYGVSDRVLRYLSVPALITFEAV